MPRVPSLALVAALAAAPAAHAQDTPTPDGPLTIRERWLGPSTMEGRSPEVITKVSVKVGPGGKAGRIRVRMLEGWDRSSVEGNGDWEWLPAEPGTYTFRAPHVPYDYRDSGIALDQETGGHVILTKYEDDPNDPSPSRHTDPYDLRASDVFRPPLADDARDVQRSERLQGHELMVDATIERDSDQDLRGDATEDDGDLTALSARITHWKDGRVFILARVRNSGTTVRHVPRVVRPAGLVDSGCHDEAPKPQPPPRWWWDCAGPAIGPGGETDVGMNVNVTGEGLKGTVPTEVTVAAEGRDTNPADNTVALTPNLELAATDARARPRAGTAVAPLRGPVPGVLVTLASDQPATVVVAARIAGVRVAKTVVFAAAGTQAVRLAPSRRADRRRVDRVLRRRGKVTAIVTAAVAGKPVYAPTQRVVLRR